MDNDIICIACSIFKKDLEKIWEKKSFDFKIIYLDSMLHMNPAKLDELLNIQTEKFSDKNIILLYGDCHSKMLDLEKNKNIYRSPGINCCNILLENKRYKELRKQGGFILIDEWVMRWKEIFQNELGFKNTQNAQMFMQEMHTKLIYLDSGNIEIPTQTLTDISEYCGLPYFVEKTNQSVLEQTITDAINWFDDENR